MQVSRRLNIVGSYLNTFDDRTPSTIVDTPHLAHEDVAIYLSSPPINTYLTSTYSSMP